MIDVYLRHQDEVHGEFFGKFPIEELPRLVKSVSEYTVHFTDENKIYEFARGEYVNDGTPIYFEVIVW